MELKKMIHEEPIVFECGDVGDILAIRLFSASCSGADSFLFGSSFYIGLTRSNNTVKKSITSVALFLQTVALNFSNRFLKHN
jgi:hypothetical protein